ncbi:MAG: hypothetical protein EOP36_01670 [Rubrivivax sp.]|nr:MAG: hypothetical protein EOP36_01670 [Rubrivivax sp.]
MADIRLAISTLANYQQLATAAAPHLVAAYQPFGINLHLEPGTTLPEDPVTSYGWQQLIASLSQRSGMVSPPAPAHVIFATVPPGLDRSINGQLLNDTRGLCALFLGASSFQTPSPYNRVDLVAQVLIHEVGHLLNLTHGDAYGYGHSDSMMPTTDRQQQTPLAAWQLAAADAAHRGEPALLIPSQIYTYPFGAQCRACLRAGATNPAWWPWRSKFRDEFGGGVGDWSDFSLDVSIDPASLPTMITLGDGISFTLRIRNGGRQPVPMPLHIGPDFGTMTVTTTAVGKAPVRFRADNYRCSSAKTSILPGQTLLRSFSLVPSPQEGLFTLTGAHTLSIELFSSDSGGRVRVGQAQANLDVVQPPSAVTVANGIAARLVATVRGHALPTKGEFGKLNAIAEGSTMAQHARYKLAMLHGGDERDRLLLQCMAPGVQTAVRHRAARQLALDGLQSGRKVSKVMSSMRRYWRDERDDELLETLERMELGWKTLLA